MHRNDWDCAEAVSKGLLAAPARAWLERGNFPDTYSLRIWNSVRTPRGNTTDILIAMAAARGEEGGLELAELSLVSPFPRAYVYLE